MDDALSYVFIRSAMSEYVSMFSIRIFNFFLPCNRLASVNNGKGCWRLRQARWIRIEMSFNKVIPQLSYALSIFAMAKRSSQLEFLLCAVIPVFLQDRWKNYVFQSYASNIIIKIARHKLPISQQEG